MASRAARRVVALATTWCAHAVRAAPTDDASSLMQGVAIASLVGVLRGVGTASAKSNAALALAKMSLDGDSRDAMVQAGGPRVMHTHSRSGPSTVRAAREPTSA